MSESDLVSSRLILMAAIVIVRFSSVCLSVTFHVEREIIAALEYKRDEASYAPLQTFGHTSSDFLDLVK